MINAIEYYYYYFHFSLLKLIIEFVGFNTFNFAILINLMVGFQHKKMKKNKRTMQKYLIAYLFMYTLKGVLTFI
jgi:hypothetical protein